MNIKELGNYELVNANTDNPILIGTPIIRNFSVQSKTSVDPSLTTPMFGPEEQVEVIDDLKTLIEDTALALSQHGDGCGAWWYITDIKSEYINKIGVATYFLVVSATVISVYDNNIPATSPSGV